MNIEDIRDALLNGRYRISDHADEEMGEDQITEEELKASVLNGEIIEEYLDDKPLPSCLIYSETPHGETVHSVWGYNESVHSVVLITVYTPDPDRWVEFRERRRRYNGDG